jgi:hypothetical protein
LFAEDFFVFLFWLYNHPNFEALANLQLPFVERRPDIDLKFAWVFK